MDLIFTTAETAAALKCARGSVAAACRSGRIKHARLVCGRWLVNVSREFPELFEKEGPQGLPTAQI